MTSTVPSAPRRWNFGRVAFDEASYELRVDGRVIEVERKPLEVLRALLDHAGKVVTKSQLVQLAWPGRVIGDAALAKAIARLREAIGDADHQIVRTHHRYGYRLVADVQTDGPSASIAPALAAPLQAPAVPRLDAEHRVLTMMFCDIVDSTSLAESLDPEAFRDLLVGYQRSTADIVRRYEGHVAQQFGDGMLFYFGYPVAHDDDAERAVRCACELLRFAGSAGTYTRLAIRIGIHTGAVVIGQAQGGADALATGSHLHVASRLQSLAEADTILVSDTTFRLVPGLFVTRDFGLQPLRGMSEAVRVHQVLQPSGARSRLETQPRLTPFVGREQEIARVESCWSQAVDGRGQALVFTGEPGIGKSRMLMQLRSHLAGRAYTWLEGRSDALNRHSAFHVVGELLRRGFALQDHDDDRQRLIDLERRLGDLDLDPDATIPLLAPLLHLPATERYPEAGLAPEQKRARTLDTLTGWITRLAEQQPMVLVVEDLHWCDDSTLEFLARLLANSDTLPLLVVATTRPEFSPAWTAGSVHRATLEALGQSEVECMVEGLAGQPLSADLTQLIYERAGGVPLFIEELVRSLRESGQIVERDHKLEARVPLGELAIPSSLGSILRARLDRLGPAREMIQTAAVIGMECDRALLQHVSAADDAALDEQLARLTASGLLLSRSAPPDARYVFKHALIRDSAYAALLKSTRQKLHARTAQAIEAHFPLRATHEPEVLAGHFENAALLDAAARYYKAAAEKAAATASFDEAIAHGEHALELITRIGADAPSVDLELEIYLILTNYRTIALGYGCDEVEQALRRVRALYGSTANRALKCRAMFFISLLHFGRAEYTQLLETAELLTLYGREIKHEPALLYGLIWESRALLNLGRLDECLDRCRQSSALLTPELAAVTFRETGQDAYPFVLTPFVYALWLCGYPDQALRTAETTLRLATERGAHPQGIAWTLNHTMGCVLTFRREPQRAVERFEQAVNLAGRNGLKAIRMYAEENLGIAYCMLGRFDEGLPMIHTAHAIKRAHRNLHHQSMRAALEAEQCRRFSRHADARAALEGGFSFLQQSDERFWEAELHRVKGELLRIEQPDDCGAAEACFQKALEISRAQNARSLELRAATSLARLLQSQRRTREAVDVLRPVYDWFTEGFDTPDLREAATLLAECAGAKR